MMPKLKVTARPGPVSGEKWRDRTRSTHAELAGAWAEWLGRLPWEAFVTLTFHNSVGLDTASREVFKWLQVVAYMLRRPVAWVYVVEPHTSGAHHAHVLLLGAGDLSYLKPASAVWRMRNGHAHVQPVTFARGIALYTTKTTAAGGEIVLADTLDRRRYGTLLRDGVVVPLIGDDAKDRAEGARSMARCKATIGRSQGKDSATCAKGGLTVPRRGDRSIAEDR